MSSRSEKLRRRQHRKDKKRKRASGLPSYVARPSDLRVVNSPDGIKMSEVLLDLVSPEWETCANEDAMQKLLTLGITAWNAALMEEPKRTEFLEDLAQTLPLDLRQDFIHIVEPFIRRKEELFPHIRRPILSFELTWQPSGDPYLSVVSGLA